MPDLHFLTLIPSKTFLRAFQGCPIPIPSINTEQDTISHFRFICQSRLSALPITYHLSYTKLFSDSHHQRISFFFNTAYENYSEENRRLHH
jgi:hypothetical protein